MIIIKESTRENPIEKLECECGNQIFLCMHQDFIEGACFKCGKKYTIKVGSNTIWNCCSEPLNKV